MKVDERLRVIGSKVEVIGIVPVNIQNSCPGNSSVTLDIAKKLNNYHSPCIDGWVINVLMSGESCRTIGHLTSI